MGHKHIKILPLGNSHVWSHMIVHVHQHQSTWSSLGHAWSCVIMRDFVDWPRFFGVGRILPMPSKLAWSEFSMREYKRGKLVLSPLSQPCVKKGSRMGPLLVCEIILNNKHIYVSSGKKVVPSNSLWNKAPSFLLALSSLYLFSADYRQRNSQHLFPQGLKVYLSSETLSHSR